MKKPDISIIIPAYNVEQLIAPCLDSILMQDGCPDFEIIVIDDGSTDNTATVIQEYASAHGNIHLVKQKNRGVSIARNNGIARSSGRFITFVDADDMVGLDCAKMAPAFDSQNAGLKYHSDRYDENLHMTFLYFQSHVDVSATPLHFDTKYFTQMLEAMRNDKTDFAMGGKITVVANQHALFRNVYETTKTYSNSIADKKIMLYHAYCRESANFALYRSKFLNDKKLSFLPHINLDEDIIFAQQAAIRANQIATVADCTYFYNRRQNTLSTQPPTLMGINPAAERATIQRHALILKELGETPRYAPVYSDAVKKFAVEDNDIQLYPAAMLPEPCTWCCRQTCTRCKRYSDIKHLVDINIDKFVTNQR